MEKPGPALVRTVPDGLVLGICVSCCSHGLELTARRAASWLMSSACGPLWFQAMVAGPLFGKAVSDGMQRASPPLSPLDARYLLLAADVSRGQGVLNSPADGCASQKGRGGCGRQRVFVSPLTQTPSLGALPREALVRAPSSVQGLRRAPQHRKPSSADPNRRLGRSGRRAAPPDRAAPSPSTLAPSPANSPAPAFCQPTSCTSIRARPLTQPPPSETRHRKDGETRLAPALRAAHRVLERRQFDTRRSTWAAPLQAAAAVLVLTDGAQTDWLEAQGAAEVLRNDSAQLLFVKASAGASCAPPALAPRSAGDHRIHPLLCDARSPHSSGVAEGRDHDRARRIPNLRCSNSEGHRLVVGRGRALRCHKGPKRSEGFKLLSRGLRRGSLQQGARTCSGHDRP